MPRLAEIFDKELRRRLERIERDLREGRVGGSSFLHNKSDLERFREFIRPLERDILERERAFARQREDVNRALKFIERERGILDERLRRDVRERMLARGLRGGLVSSEASRVAELGTLDLVQSKERFENLLRRIEEDRQLFGERKEEALESARVQFALEAILAPEARAQAEKARQLEQARRIDPQAPTALIRLSPRFGPQGMHQIPGEFSVGEVEASSAPGGIVQGGIPSELLEKRRTSSEEFGRLRSLIEFFSRRGMQVLLTDPQVLSPERIEELRRRYPNVKFTTQQVARDIIRGPRTGRIPAFISESNIPKLPRPNPEELELLNLASEFERSRGQSLNLLTLSQNARAKLIQAAEADLRQRAQSGGLLDQMRLATFQKALSRGRATEFVRQAMLSRVFNPLQNVFISSRTKEFFNAVNAARKKKKG